MIQIIRKSSCFGCVNIEMNENIANASKKSDTLENNKIDIKNDSKKNDDIIIIKLFL